MDTKVCTRCGEAKPILRFARNSGMASGRLNQCSSCRNVLTRKSKRVYTERDRIRRQRYRAKFPEKRRAERAINNRVAQGTIKRQPCEVCGAPKAHAHHDDYSKPLAVRWLCHQHHFEHHRKLREQQMEAA